MSDRFFSSEPITGPSVTLTDTEAHHLLHVLRSKPGLVVTLFDGRGGEYTAEISRCGRTEVEVAVREHHAIERELSRPLTLAVALPKGDRQRWLVEKAVELGVSRLVPLTTERSTRSTNEPPAKLARFVIEASKQCGRNRLMETAQPIDWQTLVSTADAPIRLIAHPGGMPLADCNVKSTGAAVLAVGPEGGFTDAEIVAATDAGWQVIGLGERILRVETAALALVAGLGLRCG